MCNTQVDSFHAKHILLLKGAKSYFVHRRQNQLEACAALRVRSAWLRLVCTPEKSSERTLTRLAEYEKALTSPAEAVGNIDKIGTITIQVHRFIQHG